MQNVPIASRSTGGGGAVGLTAGEVPIEVRLAAPIQGVRDERTGRKLPDGDHFSFRIEATEAVLFSFAGLPPRSRGTSPAHRVPTAELHP